MSRALRIGIAGATGSLGGELIAQLEAQRIPVAELRAYASDRSLGADVEFMGDVVPVSPDATQLRGLDLLVICTPQGAALELVRQALRAEVACLDCSGSLAGADEVPLVLASLGTYEQVPSAPLLSTPPGTAQSWAPVLAAIQAAAGLRRVVGCVLHSASAGGRGGADTLSEETIALLSQRDVAEPAVFPWPVAFDCVPLGAAEGGLAVDGEGDAKERRGEGALVVTLRRLLGRDVAVVAQSIQVPAFAGEGSSLAIETDRPLSPEAAAELLAGTRGVEVWKGGSGPSTRDAVGCERVLVGQIRADDSCADGRGLLLWLAADPVRLAARNAVELIRARFSLD